jgi:peptidoglycan L-alanyl-D-glutamate endopeptidase CwlK
MAFDERSEKLLKTLTPRAEEQARLFLQKLHNANIAARIISGTRTYAQQDALFAQGRTKPGKIVTRARGGFSNHNFGIAWDIGIFNGKDYLEESPLYAKAGKIGRDMGLEWGGDWKTIQDGPHFQCRTGKTLADLRALVKANGGDIAWRNRPIDAIVADLPTDGNSPVPATKPGTPSAGTFAPVDVFLNAKKFDIRAFLSESRVYVSASDFVDYFGGQIVAKRGGKSPTITVALNGDQGKMAVRTEDGVAFVKFADINALLGYDFKFNSTARRLTLLK